MLISFEISIDCIYIKAYKYSEASVRIHMALAVLFLSRPTVRCSSALITKYIILKQKDVAFY